MNKFLQDLKTNILVFDGSKGTMLQKMGLAAEECPELWNLKHPEKVKELYASYIEAGSDVIQTNTFGANRSVLEKFNLQDKVSEINSASVRLAKEAAGNRAYVAASIGPTGKLLEPSGDLTFEQAYNVFKEQVISVTQAGADIINFETITDLCEMRAAILAARENSPLPIIASMTFEPNGYTLMGNSPATCALVCQSLGVDLIGANCSTGPESLLEITKQFHSFSSLPLSVKANAGLPLCSGDNITYNETPETFKSTVNDFIESGVRLIGGCCGTTPEFISAIKDELSNFNPAGFTIQGKPSPGSFICSATRYINLENIKDIDLVFLIDDTNVETFEKELSEDNMDLIADRVLDISSNDARAIYLNLNMAGKSHLIVPVVKTIQTYSKLPLIFQPAEPALLESALRIYNGKAGVLLGNSIDENTFDLIFLAKKYGSTVIYD